jgi:hypothetical protein
MASEDRVQEGIEQLVQQYKQDFRIPENTDHYSVEDFRLAEKQFVRFCLKNGYTLERDFSNYSD